MTKLEIAQKYIEKGVNPSDAIALGLIEELIGEELRIEEIISGCRNKELTYKLNADGHVVRLILLDIIHFILDFFPESIRSLKFLEELNLSNNFIAEIPKWIGELKSIKVLELHTNQIKIVPKSIASLTSIEHLDLSNNKLEEFPEVLKSLTSLKYLNIKSNNIQNPPKSISHLNNLEVFLI